jgi:hypothetical protein
MSSEPEHQESQIKEQHGSSPETILSGTVFAYNLDYKKTPGGLKVRWKIRVVTGPEAARADARQAEAIRELLAWARQQQTRTPTS